MRMFPCCNSSFWKGSSSLYQSTQGCAVHGCSCSVNICMSSYLILCLFRNCFQSFLNTTDKLGKLLITESSPNFSRTKILHLLYFFLSNNLQESSVFCFVFMKGQCTIRCSLVGFCLVYRTSHNFKITIIVMLAR